MTTRKQIDQFLASGPIAMAGVSRNPKKFGRAAFDELSRKGLRIIPINPHIDNIDGATCYPDVDHLPEEVKSIIIITKKEETLRIVQDAVARGIRNIWIQQSSDTPESLNFLKGKEVNLITKQCILMHHQPNGFHKFHRNLKRLFGGMPR